MTLREILDWVNIQGEVMIGEIDTEDYEILFKGDIESEEIADEILEMYVKYMFQIDGYLKIEVSNERY